MGEGPHGVIDLDALAIDIGGTKIIAALFRDDEILVEERIPTPTHGLEEVLHALVSRVLRESGTRSVRRAGVAAPGPLDLGRGLIREAPNIRQRTVDIVAALKGLVREAVISNDAVAAAWAEKVLVGAPSDYALITIGTGIGGGIVLSGEPLLGRRGGAHEVGHMVVSLEGPPCGCGGRGHWEALAGGAWIERTLRMIWPGIGCSSEPPRGPEDLYRRARSGDECSLEAIGFLARVHAAGIASVAAAYDPEIVYLAGGLYWAGRDLYMPRIRDLLGEYAMKGQAPRLLDATYGPRQTLYGAYAIAIRPPRRLVELNSHELSPRWGSLGEENSMATG